MVATISCWLQNKINPEFLRKIIKAYGEVQPNLLKHNPNYPSAATLDGLVKNDLTKYCMTDVGPGMDSDWIIKVL